jgi:hypothetical protein
VRIGALALLGLLACGAPVEPVRGLQVRVHVDRAQARVGDALGVTIEIDTPPGFSVGRPDPPASSGAFVTEAIEPGPHLDLDGGLRHRVLWTLRAKLVGEQMLPTLRVPLVHPEGRIEPLPVGGVPFEVVSVSAELPEREVYFDLRDPPPPEAPRGPLYLGVAATAILALLLGAIWWRQRHGVIGAASDPRILARDALAQLRAADEIPQIRVRADRFSETLRVYAEQRWSLPGGITPSELEPPVADPIAELMRRLDRERFAAAPRVAEVERSGAEARAWFQDAMGS